MTLITQVSCHGGGGEGEGGGRREERRERGKGEGRRRDGVTNYQMKPHFLRFSIFRSPDLHIFNHTVVSVEKGGS